MLPPLASQRRFVRVMDSVCACSPKWSIGSRQLSQHLALIPASSLPTQQAHTDLTKIPLSSRPMPTTKNRPPPNMVGGGTHSCFGCGQNFVVDIDPWTGKWWGTTGLCKHLRPQLRRDYDGVRCLRYYRANGLCRFNVTLCFVVVSVSRHSCADFVLPQAFLFVSSWRTGDVAVTDRSMLVAYCCVLISLELIELHE